MSETQLSRNDHYLCASQTLPKYECTKCKYATHFRAHLTKHRDLFCSLKQQQYVCATRSLKKYDCSKCNYTTHYKVCLKRHVHNSDREEVKTHTCQKCRLYRSHSLLLMMKHEYDACEKTTSHNFIPVWFKCKHCQYESRHPSLVRNHSQAMHGSREICCKCQFCGHQIKTAAGMRYHITGRHVAEEDIVWYECIPCDFKTRMRENYFKHMNYHTYKMLHCQKCGYKTKSRYNLTRHIRGRHSAPEKIPWVQCQHCDFKTKWPSGLKRHQNLHICGPGYSLKEFECGHCSLKTNTKRNLQAHIVARHLNTARRRQSVVYSCQVCLHEAKTRTALRQHLWQEHKEAYDIKYRDEGKNLECFHCGFRTTTRRFLLKHIQLTHAPPDLVKWYECDKCFFQTKIKGNLNKHVRALHTAPEDIDWKRCAFCDYKAKKNWTLRAHQARKHPYDGLALDV